MKSVYVLDQSVNILTAPDAWRDKCQPVMNDAGDVIDWVIPKGTVIEGSEALLRVRTGQCTPFDDECTQAAGQSPAQLEATQRQYLAAERGIKGKKDMELFMAGVIDGYKEGTTDDKPIYIPGTNYEVWENKKAEIKKSKDKI